ncbi:hypothetical protein LMG26219_06344 [Achromobacter marplatensis]|nr:hypothetical protein LMG26219_06344 [Achromobacter marplatensis]
MKEFLSLVKSVSYLFALSHCNYFTAWHRSPFRPHQHFRAGFFSS